ncbi:MAG: DMT family transporter [Acidimicrobiales bacterium]
MSERSGSTGTGTEAGSFELLDWGLIGSVAVIWGSSFLWIAVALDAFAPGLVAWLRVLFGAVTLFMFSGARRRIEPRDRFGIAIVAVAGNAGPALLFALAQRDLESAVAGMINSATPVATLVIALALGNRAVGRGHVVGLLLGFAGVIVMAAPDLRGADAPVMGIGLVLLAVVGYALTNNVIVPLQQRYGGLAVVAHAQALAAVLLLPFGLVGLRSSKFEGGAFLAVVILGILGTGLARVLSATLVGRTGPQRGSVVTYFVPIVAILLGVSVRNETISSIQIFGLLLVLTGAGLISRR